jgi:hypothetical protein
VTARHQLLAAPLCPVGHAGHRWSAPQPTNHTSQQNTHKKDSYSSIQGSLLAAAAAAATAGPFWSSATCQSAPAARETLRVVKLHQTHALWSCQHVWGSARVVMRLHDATRTRLHTGPAQNPDSPVCMNPTTNRLTCASAGNGCSTEVLAAGTTRPRNSEMPVPDSSSPWLQPCFLVQSLHNCAPVLLR